MKRMDSPGDCGRYVGLNVGGKIYQTSHATLTRYEDSFFTGMLDGSIPSAKDEQGNYLVDRDGEIFRHILNFLRSGKLTLPHGFDEYDLLESEADFYSIEDLVGAIHRSETVGIVEISGSIVYKMSRQSLMREKDSFFAKRASGQINPVKDSHGNFVVESGGPAAELEQIMEYLKYGIIMSPLKYNSPSNGDLLSKMAARFGLQLLKNQIHLITSYQNVRSPLRVFYWYDGPDCGIYFQPSVWDFSRICVDSTCIFSPSPGTSIYAGLVDLRQILPDAPVALENVQSYFSQQCRGFEGKIQELSPGCAKITFSMPFETCQW